MHGVAEAAEGLLYEFAAEDNEAAASWGPLRSSALRVWRVLDVMGRVLVLENPGQVDTNAGQNIRWRILKRDQGRKHCKLLYPNNGSVTLRIRSKGECTVVGTAPAVAGEWQRFRTVRKYRGR